MAGLFGALKHVVRAFIDPEYRKKYEPSRDELFEKMWKYLEFDNTTNMLTLVSTLVGTTVVDIDHLILLWNNMSKNSHTKTERAQTISIGMSLLTIDRFMFPGYIDKRILDDIAQFIIKSKETPEMECFYASMFDATIETLMPCENKRARLRAYKDVNKNKYPWLRFTYDKDFVMKKPPIGTSEKILDLPEPIVHALESFDSYKEHPEQIELLLLKIKETSALDVLPERIEEMFGDIAEEDDMANFDALYAAEITSVANVIFCKIQHLIYIDSLRRMSKNSGVH